MTALRLAVGAVVLLFASGCTGPDPHERLADAARATADQPAVAVDTGTGLTVTLTEGAPARWRWEDPAGHLTVATDRDPPAVRVDGQPADPVAGAVHAALLAGPAADTTQEWVDVPAAEATLPASDAFGGFLDELAVTDEGDTDRGRRLHVEHGPASARVWVTDDGIAEVAVADTEPWRQRHDGLALLSALAPAGTLDITVTPVAPPKPVPTGGETSDEAGRAGTRQPPGALNEERPRG